MSSVVRLQAGETGLGTGFVVYSNRETCLVMTAFHVVQRVAFNTLRVRVIFPGGQPRFDGYVQEFMETADLALISFDPHGQIFEAMKFAELSISSSMQLVSPVYLRGYHHTPFGEISSPGCFCGRITGDFTLHGTTVHCLRGNYPCEAGTSGGPVTMEGRVVGVNVSADAAESLAISVLGVHTALVLWTRGRARTIDEMLELLAQ